MLGIVFALALSLLIRVRAVAVALSLALAGLVFWAMLLAPGGPGAVLDLATDRLAILVGSGFWLGLASASTVVHVMESMVRHARRKPRKRGDCYWPATTPFGTIQSSSHAPTPRKTMRWTAH